MGLWGPCGEAEEWEDAVCGGGVARLWSRNRGSVGAMG